MALFNIPDAYDASIDIGGKPLPIKIRRWTKREYDAFYTKRDELMLRRGTVEQTPSVIEELGLKYKAFVEATVADSVTLEEGVLSYRGQMVTNGAGLIEAFYPIWPHVFPALINLIAVKNDLEEIDRKNWSSPRASGTGSTASTQERGGEQPEPIAASVDSSPIAAIEDATGYSWTETSGPLPEPTS